MQSDNICTAHWDKPERIICMVLSTWSFVEKHNFLQYIILIRTIKQSIEMTSNTIVNVTFKQNLYSRCFLKNLELSPIKTTL